MAIDRAKFFDGVRNGPFTGSLTVPQTAGISAILDEWERRKLTDLRFLAYMLATTYHETARTMQPINEIGKGKGRKYGVADAKTGQTYYGRGFVQLTWLDNYKKMGDLLKVDLVNKPEMALNLNVASQIMFEGMIRGSFTGKKLVDYFSATTDDPVNARKIINGLDQAQKIAGYHKQFLSDLKAADTAQATAPTALPVPTTVPETKQDVKEIGAIGGIGAVATGAWHAVVGSGAFQFALVAVLGAAAYWFIVRPILRRMTALEGFYTRADEAELGLLTKVRLALKGFKSLLWGRILALAGVLGGLLQYADVIDFSTILPPVGGIPAAAYVPLVLGPALGIVNNWLRKMTTTPIGATDLALVPDAEAPPLVPVTVDAPEFDPVKVIKGVREKKAQMKVKVRAKIAKISKARKRKKARA